MQTVLKETAMCPPAIKAGVVSHLIPSLSSVLSFPFPPQPTSQLAVGISLSFISSVQQRVSQSISTTDLMIMNTTMSKQRNIVH